MKASTRPANRHHECPEEGPWGRAATGNKKTHRVPRLVGSLWQEAVSEPDQISKEH